jgi:hypothetical protein
MAVDKDHETLSSYPGIVIGDQPPEFIVKKFIAEVVGSSSEVVK